MNEKIDWEKKLQEAGMPEELPPLGEELSGIYGEVASEFKKPSFEKEILDMPDPAIRMALEKFETLPEEQQRVIIEDIKRKKETNMPLVEIISRIYSLVEGTYRMVNIPYVGSEKEKEKEEKKEEEEKKGRTKTIDEILAEMEKISYERAAAKKDGLVN